MRYSDYAYDEFQKILLVPEIEVISFDYEDIAGASGSGLTLKAPVEPGTLVLGVGLLITDEFATATTFTLGDADAADSYSTTTDHAIGTLNNFYLSLGHDRANAQGKYYAALNHIKITADAAPSAGEGKLMIYKVKGFAGNWRVPAV